MLKVTRPNCQYIDKAVNSVLFLCSWFGKKKDFAFCFADSGFFSITIVRSDLDVTSQRSRSFDLNCYLRLLGLQSWHKVTQRPIVCNGFNQFRHLTLTLSHTWPDYCWGNTKTISDKKGKTRSDGHWCVCASVCVCSAR